MVLVLLCAVLARLIHAAPIYTSSCALSTTPCPLPTWEATWQLNASTIAYASNSSGFVDPLIAARYGLVSFDWDNAYNLWFTGKRNETTCEELLVEQARMVKAVNNRTKVFVYRNTELGLEWLSTERAVMYSNATRGFFLQYQTGPKTGQIYNEPIGCGDQFFWDFRNTSAQDYYIQQVCLNMNGAGNTLIDGVFTDDVSGLGEEHPKAAPAMGLSASQVDAIRAGTQSMLTRLFSALVARQKYNWQMFGYQDGLGSAPAAHLPFDCSRFMREHITPAVQQRVLTMQMDDKEPQQVLAAFLIARGPYAFIGYGSGSAPIIPAWNPIFDLDIGSPIGLGKETFPGIFERNWTAGVVRLDCNTWKATLPGNTSLNL